jgi:hypothetical protein
MRRFIVDIVGKLQALRFYRMLLLRLLEHLIIDAPFDVASTTTWRLVVTKSMQLDWTLIETKDGTCYPCRATPQAQPCVQARARMQ